MRKRYRIFKVTTMKQTNTLPIRIKIEDLWRGGHKVIGYSCDGPSDRTEAAIHFLNKKGIEISAEAFDQNAATCFLMSDDFKTPIA